MKVLIIGGVAGGASAAARLRRLDENAEITILERGGYVSYANCGLPYYVGGAITEKSDLVLKQPEEFYERFRVEVKLNHEAMKIDRENKKVTALNHETGEELFFYYDKLILSPGAEPIKPNIPGSDDERVFTLRTIPDTYRIKEYMDTHKPKKAVIVGGGYIGIEMAENLTEAGLAVTVVELSDHIIGPLDFDMAADVHRYIKNRDVQLILNNGVKAIESGEKGLLVQLSEGCIETDIVLLSVGVKPDSKLAIECGLETNPRGAIVTDEHLRTSDAHIYAVGDAIQVKNLITQEDSFIPLAGPANKQGRIAADNICGISSVYKGTQGSAVLKIFEMTVATTGVNEKEAQRAGLDYDKIYLYSASHATYYPGALFMSIKVLFENVTGRILGAQIVGFDGVDKRCDVFASAIRHGLTAMDLAELELSYAPPFSSAKDPVNMAGFAIENILSGRVKQYHWHDVEELQKKEDIILLDTRTTHEYSTGAIEKTVNIPLDELRERINELDKNKTVYVNCQSGLRSYIACRILSQNGFDCYNLSGGYRLYNSVISEIESQ